MKLYLDNIIFSLQRAGGISVVWQNLIKNLLPIADNLHFIEYQNASQNIFQQELEIPSSKIEIAKNFSPIFSPFKHPTIKSDAPFIFHSSYFRTCNNPNAINVTTVHDFIYEQGVPTLKQKLRIALNYKVIRKSDAIVCISENTKKDLFKFIPDINPEKVHVIYNGVSEDYYHIDDISIPEYHDCVLFVGGRQSYKNFDFVVKALKQTRYRLLICGAPLKSDEISLLEEYLPERYIHVKFPTNEELNRIYNSVYALAYPSSYEGFGLPVLEAQRAGCPVIALSASSIPEIIGKNSLLLPELSSVYFEKMLNRIDNQDERKNIIDSGLENVKRFSWNRMAKEYFNLYQKLLSTSH